MSPMMRQRQPGGATGEHGNYEKCGTPGKQA
jgi:hypothetical protein